MEKMLKYTTVFLIAAWLLLAGILWFGGSKAISDTERRPLAQMPTLSGESLLDGSFMQAFESYTQDQFPFREAFRQLKATVNYQIFRQKDNHNIYISDGSAAELLYPLNEDSLDHALLQFGRLYDRLLADTDCKIYSAVIPDKGYYLTAENSYPAMDYEKLFSVVAAKMPWATHISLTDTLSADSYYRTDTHWRQETLQPVAQKLVAVMGVNVGDTYEKREALDAFYGVYYGQAALPIKPDSLYLLESKTLSACRVYSYEKDVYRAVYDLEKLQGKDPYEVFLSGPEALLRIENPNAKTDRQLIVFRDSFASSLIPLLLRDYKTVILADLRYLSPAALSRFITFESQDVLFLHSTLVLNKKLI